MFNESRHVASRLTPRGLMARSLTRLSRSVVNPSLPGFAELGGMVKELVEDWKTANHNDNELTWIATRIEDLCSLVHEFDVAEHPDVSNASRRFHELKNSLVEGFNHRPCSGIHGAEQKQRLLDDLNREINRVVEMTLLRLALVQAQSSKHNPIDNFQVISAHEITGQIPAYGAAVCWDPLVPTSENISWLFAPGRPVVTSSARRARLGKAPVIYKTFSSRSDSGVAAKVAEAELKYLSKCLHPNVASVIGVTKGYDGLNGYAVAAEGVSLDQFLLRVDSGAALVKLIRDIDDVRANMMDNLRYQIDVEHVTVKPNGHLTVFPELHQYSGFDMRGCFGLPEDNRAALNPPVLDFLNAYWYCPDPSPSCNPLYTGFFDSITMLDWKTFTRLEIARLAAKYKVLPEYRYYRWTRQFIPPYTISSGDIGRSIYSSQYQPNTWSLIKLKRAPGIQWHYRCECGHAEGARTCMEGDWWTSITLHICGRSWFEWGQDEPGGISYEQAKQARASLRGDRLRVERAQYCTAASCSVRIDRTGSIERPFKQLYFHRNPSMRSNPQAFWGFPSTSLDPCSSSIVPGELGLELTYDIRYETYCLSDFWDYMYEEMLRSSLASIPGGYPGSYVEEVPEDEVIDQETLFVTSVK